MRESQSHNGNGSNRANVANGSNGSNGPVPGERQWREDIKPFVPNTGESFEDAKARYAQLIRQSDVDHWHTHGYVIIRDFLTPQEMEALGKAWNRMMPDWEEYKARKSMYQTIGGASQKTHNSIIRYDFPYPEDALNELAVHPFLVAFAERLVGSDDLAISLGHLIGKYAGKGDYDQSLHSDSGNNTLVTPTNRKEFMDIPMIVYLTDVPLDHGPTKVLSQQHTEHRDMFRNGHLHASKSDFPELYKHEVPVVVPAGSVIIYSMRTFHRGSAMTTEEGCRIVQFSGYHSASAPWMAPLDHQAHMGSKESNRFLTHADPRQRQMIGFPGVGHEYWKEEEMREAVSMRYREMDMRPYGGGPPKAQAQAQTNGH